MNLESLHCNNCGAMLDVPSSANYIKCNHCDSNLIVRRDASATFTELAEQLQKTTANLSAEVDELRKQNQIAELDRSWAIKRDSLMVLGKDGTREPSVVGSTFTAVFGVIFGLIWVVITLNAFPIMAIFGFIFIAAAVVKSAKHIEKANQLKSEKRLYEIRRRQLSQEIGRGASKIT